METETLIKLQTPHLIGEVYAKGPKAAFCYFMIFHTAFYCLARYHTGWD